MVGNPCHFDAIWLRKNLLYVDVEPVTRLLGVVDNNGDDGPV